MTKQPYTASRFEDALHALARRANPGGSTIKEIGVSFAERDYSFDTFQITPHIRQWFRLRQAQSVGPCVTATHTRAVGHLANGRRTLLGLLGKAHCQACCGTCRAGRRP